MLSFRPFAPEDADIEHFQTITQTLQQKRVLQFRYRNHGTTEERLRTVHPYHCAFIDSRWYLFAFDVERNAMRTFALTRLREPVITDETFTPTLKFDPNQYLQGSMGAFKGVMIMKWWWISMHGRRTWCAVGGGIGVRN